MITIGETTLPSPSSYKWSENDLSSDSSGRNLAGEMLKDLVAKKIKIELEWGPLTKNDASTVLTALASAVYLQVTYPDAKAGADVTKTMYVGDRDSDLLLYHNVNGVEYWTGIRANLIEK